MICSEPDCDRKTIARGLCGRHYQSATKYNRLPPLVVNDECSGPVVARGMCQKHWRRAKKAGAFKPRKNKPRGIPCEAEGCDRKARAGGLCGPHYRAKKGYKTKPPTKSQNAETALRKGRVISPQQSLGLRVLARTCGRCGELITTPDHLIRKDAGVLPPCKGCSVKLALSYKKRREAVDEQYKRRLRVRTEALRKRNNDRLAAEALNARKEWTSAEMELAARFDLSAAQVGKMIGRSMYAVKYKRQAMKKDPRAESLVGQVYDVANERAQHMRELVSK